MLPRDPNISAHLWPFRFSLYVPEIVFAEKSSQALEDILGSQQRGGFREAYGDPPRCPRLLRGVTRPTKTPSRPSDLKDDSVYDEASLARPKPAPPRKPQYARWRTTDSYQNAAAPSEKKKTK